MPLMGSFYVGQSGLQTSSNALNTSAHNLANVQTAGYTRQQVLQGSKSYNTIGNAGVSAMQTGLGVDYTKCRQVRDVFLDASYRTEGGRAAFYGICAETTNEIETLLGEMEGASFKESLGTLWTSVQELQKDPSSAVTQGLFVTTCATFLERAKAVAQGLIDYQNNLNQRVYGMVDTINDITDKLFKNINQVNRAEIGIEQANDLRDERNALIDQLSKLVNVKTVENPSGGFEVYCEGVPLIIGDCVNHLKAVPNESGFYDVTWGPLYDNMPLYNHKQVISADNNTDIGELRALILARGDHSANYSDVVNITADEYNHGSGLADKNDIPIANSMVMNVQAEFDQLIHSITTMINNVMCDYAENKSGTSCVEVFSRIGCDNERYDASGDYIKEDTKKSPSDFSTMYTVMNIRINPDLIKQPTLNNFMLPDKTVDYEKAAKVAEVFAGVGQVKDLNTGTYTDTAVALNPNASSKFGYVAYYDSMVGAIANTGSVYINISDGQQATVASLEEARQQVLGVSSEEELQNIIKFQNAYNAASRYINVVNAMLGHLIERM